MRFWALVASLAALGGISGLRAQTVIPSSNERPEQAVFFFGDVLLEDGSVPPDSVLIQRVCRGRVIFAARTDPRGHFSFSVEGTAGNAVPTDASQPGAQAPDTGKALNGSSSQYTNPITSALQDCELQAILAGFRVESVRLAVHSTSDAGRIGTLFLHPLSRAGALTVSVTTAAAPANARRAYEKGLEAASNQKWDAAADEFTKAVTIYPKYAIAWYQLGRARLSRNEMAGAMEAWNEARKQDPKYVSPYQSLAAVADRQQDWTASEEYSREWFQLDPEDFPAAYLFNAVANARLNRIEAAESAARGGLRVDKDRRLPRLNFVLGLILMQKQQYAEAVKCFQAYLELAPDAHDAAAVREQLMKLEQGAAAGRPN
jgi:tetratricopeptide (TPR) repeat protein